MLLFMAIVFVVVALGVKGGIEKANLIDDARAHRHGGRHRHLHHHHAGRARRRRVLSDARLQQVLPELVIGAMGQMFYSLSLAMGIMITYGSYLNKKESLPHGVVRIGGFDLGVSFLAGLMSRACGVRGHGVGRSGRREGGSVAYVNHAPRRVWRYGGAATIVGFLFFLLVLFAALTSAISLTETCVSIISDGAGWVA